MGGATSLDASRADLRGRGELEVVLDVSAARWERWPSVDTVFTEGVPPQHTKPGLLERSLFGHIHVRTVTNQNPDRVIHTMDIPY